jgi:hypothetical protein
MSNFNTDNLICIHLNIFSTFELIERMCDDNNLDVDPKYLWEFKKQDYHKVWLDKDTYQLIVWTESRNKKIMCLNEQYLNYLRNMKSLVHIRKERTNTQVVTPSNNNNNNDQRDFNQSILDIILDKISSKGIGSLSDKEKDFLSKYSD